MIPWVRFYPEPISLHPGASYVVDCLPKRPVYQDRYGEALDDAFRTFGGFVCVEWDIALDRDERRAARAVHRIRPRLDMGSSVHPDGRRAFLQDDQGPRVHLAAGSLPEPSQRIEGGPIPPGRRRDIPTGRGLELAHP